MNDILRWLNFLDENDPIRPSDHFPNDLEKVADFLSPGAYYYYIFNYSGMELDFVHPNIEEVLGVAPQDFLLENYVNRIHPEEVKMAKAKEELANQFLLEEISSEKILEYKVVYRNKIKNVKGKYLDILHQEMVLSLTEERKIEHSMGIHTDITHLDILPDHKISFIDMKGDDSRMNIDPENPTFSPPDLINIYSPRELQVLDLLSKGNRSKDIAETLEVSLETVRTHRKNILAKCGCKNMTELVVSCIKEGLI